jgi:hypothetical protein
MLIYLKGLIQMDNNKKIALLIDLQKAAKDNFIVETLKKLDNGDFIAELWANTVQKEINSILGDVSVEQQVSSELLDMLNRITETPVVVLMKTLISRLDNPNLVQQNAQVTPYQPAISQEQKANLMQSRGNPLF